MRCDVRRVVLLLVVWAVLAGGASAQVGFRQLTSTHPVAVQRGEKSEVQLRSNFTLDEAYQVDFDRPGLRMKFLETKPIAAPRKGRGSKGTPFRFEVDVPGDQMPGVYEYRVATRQAVSSVAQLLVTDYPVTVEDAKQENGAIETAQSVELPAAVCGVCEKFEDVDCFRFEARAGQQVRCEMFAQRVTDRIHSMVVRGPRIYLMDPILSLIGPNGQIVAQNDNFYGGDPLLTVVIPRDGTYTLEVRDARYAGDPRYTYCVELSAAPFAFEAFPAVVQVGRTGQLKLDGINLGGNQPLPWKAESYGWQRIRLAAAGGLTNPVWVKGSAFPQKLDTEPNNDTNNPQQIQVPCGVSGRLQDADDIDYYKFSATKGRHYLFEIESRRYGSPLDSLLEMWDANGKRLVEADDLSNLKTKDSRLYWTAPADGDYLVSVRDLHDRGGPRFVYHLRAEETEPTFDVAGEFYYSMLAPGTRMMWFAKIERHLGFDQPVQIEVRGLPRGVRQVPVTIPAHMNHCGIILEADTDAPINASLVEVVGRAIRKSADEHTEIVRRGQPMCEQQSSGGGQARWPIATQQVAVTKPLDLVDVMAEPAEVVLVAGQTVEIKVKIKRREGFKDAVQLAASFDYFATKLGQQLPPGVTVSGKSKTRLTGDVLEGSIILTAGDKVTPIERFPIAVLARVSITFSITTNYASNPVYLTIKQK